MAYLYLTEQGATLRKTGERLVVEKDDEVLLDIPCCKIRGVLLFGNIQCTTQAMHELLAHDIELSILTKGGRLLGQLTTPSSKNIELRIKQFRKFEDPAFRTMLSRTIVHGKLINCLHLVKMFSYNHPEQPLAEESRGLKATIENAISGGSIPELRGIEGSGARIYFGAYGKMMLGDMTFEGRKKHPATDPVNALLSFGYTLLFSELSSILDSMGFDPYLGYFHEIEYGRASLAVDLQEEFRAVIDRFTLCLINNRMLCDDDFFRNEKDGSVYLTHAAMKKYLAEHDRYFNREFNHNGADQALTFRKCYRIQVEKLARTIRENEVYEPFRLEG